MRKVSVKWLKITTSLLGAGLMISSASFTTIQNDKQIVKTNVTNQAIDSRAVDGAVADLTFEVNSSPTWKGQKFADQVTNEDIKGMLKPDKEYGANFYVKILPIDTNMLTQGYVNFVVVQLKPKFENGVNTEKMEKVYINAKDGFKAFDGREVTKNNTTVDGDTVSNEKIWSTKMIDGLFLQKKYSFKWNSDSEIGDFLKQTSKTTLTSEDILSNFVSTVDSTDILPPDTHGTFSQETITFGNESTLVVNNDDNINDADAKKYGVGKITISFEKAPKPEEYKIDENQWVGGHAPTIDQTTRIVRGLADANGNKHTVQLNVENNIQQLKSTTLDLTKIKQQNPTFKDPIAATGTTARISDFTPSQLINALNGNLKDLLATTQYVPQATSGGEQKPATTLPPIYVSYMDKNAFTNSNMPFQGTGLSHQTNVPYVDKNYNPIMNGNTPSTTGTNSVNNLMNIVNITGSADDEKGVLSLKVKYNYYDVYKNVMVSDYEVPLQITGMKVNKDANKNLFFNWKSDGDLMYSSASDFYNMYQQNQDDATFLQDLSNSLFYGSTDTYAKPRKFTLEKIDNQATKLKATIVFDTYGDNYYIDEKGQKVPGLKETNTFTFQNATSNNSVQFNTTENVKSEIKNWEQYTPEQLINDISENKIDKNIFFKNSTYSTNASINNQANTRADENVLFIPNETNNGIIVRVYKGNEMFASSFTGLAQGQSQDFIYNFSFTPNTEDQNYQKLLNIPVEQITKQNVIDLYLKDLDIFKVYGNQFELTENDVQLTPNPEKGFLEIAVTVNGYDSSNPDANRIFKTTLQGLKSQTLVDNNSYVAPLNLTIPLSAVFAGVITIALGTTLFLIVRKRMKLNKVNKSRKPAEIKK